MIESPVLQTGTMGLMKVADNTDGTDKTVDLYIQSSAPITVPQLPWSFSIDGVKSDTRSFNFTNTTAWQHVDKIFVDYASEFVFHIDNTGTAELGGPTDLTVQLQNGTRVVFINVNGVYVPAIPYVNVGGVDGAGGTWKPAVPYVLENSTWTEVV